SVAESVEPEPEIVESAAEPALEEAVSAEPTAPAEPVMEERLGWRQKSLEPRAPRPPRHKPAHRSESEGAGDRNRDTSRYRKQGQPGDKPAGKPDYKGKK